MTLPSLLRAHPRDWQAIDIELGIYSLGPNDSRAEHLAYRTKALADWIAANVPETPPEPDLDEVIGRVAGGLVTLEATIEALERGAYRGPEK